MRTPVVAPPESMAARPHLVDTTLFFSPTSGGVRRYLLAKHAWLGGHAAVRHTLLVPGPADTGAADGVVEFASPAIPFGAGYRWPVRGRGFRERLRSLAPDLVEAGDPYVVGWQAARACAEAGVPAVAFCHSDLIGLLDSRLGAPAGAAAARWLRRLYARYDLVLAPSRPVAARLADAGIRPVVVQPLGVDADTFAPDRADPRLRRSLDLPPGATLLVFAGRLAPEKNLEELVAAVDLLGDPYHLLVIGGTERRRVAPRVTHVPYEREPSRVAAWLAGADVLVHAGRSETFGLVAVEAMACGLPVVCYAAGALPEVVDAGVGALAPANGGPAALAAAIAGLRCRDPAELRAAARARVLERHTWDRVLRAQLRTYAGLLHRASLLRVDPTACVRA